ncbi:SMC family ATPase [Candidatus Woesearchaeota archaeon]|nr:SMC family ATPase [Candidatus Woesearchaeota archaeon]
MLIKSVKLHNIRSYLSQDVAIPEGTVLLSGDIGSGKSTILLAIEFALFGINKGLLSGEALLRNGKQSGFVELAFSFDGRDVVIRRSLKRVKDSVRQDEGFISVNGLKQFCTADEIKARVLEMLGYPKELLRKSKGLIYRFTVYTPQEDMKRILFEDPQARLDTLRRVFQIEKYKLVREGTAIVLQALRERRRELAARIEDLPQKQEQLSKISGDLAAIDARAKVLLPLIESSETSVSEKKAQLRALEEKSREISLLKSRFAALIAIFEEKRSLMALREKEVSSLKSEIALLQEGLSDNSSALSQLSFSLSRLKSFSDYLLGDIGAKKQLEGELASAEQLKSEAESELGRNEALKASAQQLLEKISALSSCPTCLQPVESGHKHSVSAEQESRIAGFAVNIASASGRKSSSLQRIISLRTRLVDIQSKEKIVAVLSSELKPYFELASVFNVSLHSQQVQQFGNQSQVLQQAMRPVLSVAEMQAELSILSSARKALDASRERTLLASEKEKVISLAERQVSSWKSELQALDSEKGILLASIERFGDVQAESAALHSELDRLVNDHTALMMQKAALEREIESLSAAAKSLAGEIARKESARKELESSSNLAFWLDEMFTGLVSVIERHVMMKVHQEFNVLFRDWFTMLMGTDSLSARIDEEFTPVVEQDGFDTPIENLSGGEKTSCALAYRLALNVVINNLVSTIRTKDLLILDEPTDGFSSEQLDKLRDVLMQMQLPQVIIVSHEDKIESFVQHVIRVQKEQHVSRVVA